MKVSLSCYCSWKVTLIFISHNFCPRETHLKQNRIKSSWTFKIQKLSTSWKSLNTPNANQINLKSTGIQGSDETEGTPPLRVLLIWLFRAWILKGESGDVEENAFRETRHPLELGWAARIWIPPLAYSPGPVSSGWLPPLLPAADTRISAAWKLVLQSARAKRFSPLVTKLEKGQRRATRMVINQV